MDIDTAGGATILVTVALLWYRMCAAPVPAAADLADARPSSAQVAQRTHGNGEWQGRDEYVRINFTESPHFFTRVGSEIMLVSTKCSHEVHAPETGVHPRLQTVRREEGTRRTIGRLA